MTFDLQTSYTTWLLIATTYISIHAKISTFKSCYFSWVYNGFTLFLVNVSISLFLSVFQKLNCKVFHSCSLTVKMNTSTLGESEETGIIFLTRKSMLTIRSIFLEKKWNSFSSYASSNFDCKFVRCVHYMCFRFIATTKLVGLVDSNQSLNGLHNL